MGKDPKAGGFKSPEKEPPLPSRGSPLLNTDVKVLTTIVNLDHKQPNEWEQLILPSPETQDTLLRNYQKSKVKLEWLSGRYSNICSPISLPENIMYPMDAETWGEILEAELKRYVEKSQADLITLRV